MLCSRAIVGQEGVKYHLQDLRVPDTQMKVVKACKKKPYLQNDCIDQNLPFNNFITILMIHSYTNLFYSPYYTANVVILFIYLFFSETSLIQQNI